VSVKSRKRALDAFSIASHQSPDKIRIRQHRLGASEGGNKPGKKRARDEHDEEDEQEESHSRKHRKRPAKGRFDELDVDEDSDSEGNNWKLGQVGSDEDSDLDSDEAFGESDEERFDGFTFGGSSDKKSKKQASKLKGVALDEDEEGSGSELSDDSFGEDAIDLATMLDQTAEDSDEKTTLKRQQRTAKQSDSMEDGKDEAKDQWQDDEESDSAEDEDAVSGNFMEIDAEESDSISDEEENEDSDDESSASSAEDETLDPTKLAAMHEMINALPQATESKRAVEKQQNDGGFEYKAPSNIAPASKTKLVFEDAAQNKESRGKSATKALKAPISKREQDRLDRSAAYDKTKETLDRWTDTVKHNRRAEHLIFPLPDNDLTSAHANTRLQPTTQAKPFNELEATIQSILEESGLAAANGKDDEDRIREFEELETKKMSVEEVKARRDQLRMARELLFREEAKAKRIKKIKSKSYRKVHRKQREKEERLNKEALAQGGFVPSEDELEAQDRRRAEERMGAKHQGSKWAKAMKGTGRAAWDEDARAGITEMARRDEELRKRIEGRVVRNEGSDVSSSDSDDEVNEEDDEDEERRILQQLDRVGTSNGIDESAPGGKLANMKFMLKADAARRKENDTMVEDIRKQLAGEESASEEEDGDVGRRIFGPRSKKAEEMTLRGTRNEFEEPGDSEDDGANSDIEIRGLASNPKRDIAMPRDQKSNGFTKGLQLPSSKSQQDVPYEGGAWSKPTSKSSMLTDAEARKRRQKKNSALEVEELDLSTAGVISAQPKPKKTKKILTTLDAGSEEESDDNNAVQLPFAIRDHELIKRAFAGADVVGEFEAEKKQTIEDEEEKVIDNTLPGWGSWTGEGLSKKEKAKNKGKVLTKVEGIKEKDRKDAKLERVIMNEKRVKKVSRTFHLRSGIKLTMSSEWQVSCLIPSSSFRDETTVREISPATCGARMGDKGDIPGCYEA
jgi:U3 small nucleolar RNA-associated protein 14